MFRNLVFAILFFAVVGCNRNDYPTTFTDATGTYRQVQGNQYHRIGDKLTSKGYRVYKMKFVKGFENDPSQVVVNEAAQR